MLSAGHVGGTRGSAGPHGRLAQKTVNLATIAGGGKLRHNVHSSL